MAYKKITKLTSGALLLSATSAITSQAQGGVSANNKALTNAASKVFLEKGVGSSKGVTVLKVLGISFVVIVLGVAVGMMVHKEMKKRRLNTLGQLIDEVKKWEVKDFLKRNSEQYAADATKRNEKTISSLKKKVAPFKTASIESSLENFESAVEKVFRAHQNMSGYRDEVRENDKFLAKAPPALKELKIIHDIYNELASSEAREEKIQDEEERNKIIEILQKYSESENWDFGKEIDGIKKADLSGYVSSILKDFQKSYAVKLSGECWDYLHTATAALEKAVKKAKFLHQEHYGAFDTASSNFKYTKENLIKSLEDVKKQEKQNNECGFLGLFKSLSQLPIFNDGN